MGRIRRSTSSTRTMPPRSFRAGASSTAPPTRTTATAGSASEPASPPRSTPTRSCISTPRFRTRNSCFSRRTARGRAAPFPAVGERPGESHLDLIRDQFTRQAEAFATAPAILDEEALALLVRHSGANPDDQVLDVACGPGIVACAFARAARRVTGIDVTGAMIDRARALAAERGLTNVEFRVGEAAPLPFPDGSFTLALCRYSFHHFPDPPAVFAEMLRAVRRGGRVLVADVMASPDPRRADRFNSMERLRDPSHVRALPLAELESLFTGAGLPK